MAGLANLDNEKAVADQYARKESIFFAFVLKSFHYAMNSSTLQ